METIITCLQEQHDLRLVGVAALICLTSSIITMLLIGNCGSPQSVLEMERLLTAIAVCSVGIWATHFVAILGYDPGVPVTYGVGTTAVSALFSFFTVAFGLYFSLYYNTVVSHLLGGLYLGLGVAVMHLLGMFAVQSVSWMIFDLPTTYVAIAVGCMFSAAALASLRLVESKWRYGISSVLLVLGICSLHFISMSWTEFYIPPFYEEAAEAGLNSAILAAAVFSLWSLIVGFAYFKYLRSDRARSVGEPSGVIVAAAA